MFTRKCFPSIAVFLLLAGIAAIPVSAASFNVADGDVSGLINAIEQANTSAEDDVIHLATSGTYTLNAVHNTDPTYGPNGLPIIGMPTPANGAGKLTIEGNGATLLRSTTGGTPDFRFFQTYQDTQLEIRNLTLRNGRNPESGGALFVRERNTLMLNGCRFEDNRSTETGGFGGGGAVHYKHLTEGTITNCHFIDNHADASGGALQVQLSNLTLSACTFSGNTSLVGNQNAAGGGAIFVDGAAGDHGTISISESSFNNNSAVHQGGGIFLQLYNGNSGSVSHCSFAGNLCTGEGFLDGLGGAIIAHHDGITNASANYTNPSLSSSLTIEASLFDSNRAASQGGGLWKTGDMTLTLTNCTFYGNRAQNAANTVGLGGALNLSISSGTHLIEHCTITENEASQEGGGFVAGKNTTMKHSILADNHAHNPWNTKQNGSDAGGWKPDPTTYLTDGGGNVEYHGTHAVPSTDNWLATASATVADPLLQTLTDNGGHSQTIALGTGSPAIGLATGSSISKDQRGFDRDASPDAGAFEAGATSASAYSLWTTAQSLTGGAADVDADPDGDGLKNALEFALGGNPQAHDSASVLPTVGYSSDRLTFTFTLGQDANVLTYAVEYSEDLLDWSTIPNDPVPTTRTAGEEIVMSKALPSDRLFARLKVDVIP